MKNFKESLLFRYWNYIKTWRYHRDVIKKLNKLSDRELNDIGLNRHEIDRLIWLEYDKNIKRMMENKK